MDITLNGVQIRNDNIKSLDEAIAYINTFTNPADGRDGTGVIATKKEDGSGITFTNQNSNGTTDNMKNIDLQINTGNQAGELQNVPVANGNFNWNAMNLNSLTAQGDSKWIAGNFQNNGNRVQVVTAHKYVYSSNPVQIAPMYNPDGGKTWNQGDMNTAGTPENNYRLAVNGALLNTQVRTFRTTEDLRELLQRDARYGVDYDGSGGFEANGSDVNEGVTITITENGNFSISNPNKTTTPPAGIQQNNRTNHDLNFNVTAYTDALGKVSTNDAFTKIFKAFDGVQTVGSQKKESEQLKLSAFSAGLEIYDSLGSKHTLEVQFVKQSTTQDGGNEWQMIIRVPEPAEINTTGEGPNNIVVGTARFNNDGSLASYNPKTLNFSPNNGAAPNQQIKLSFGTSGSNDGLVSSNSASTLTGQATDGYTSGNLKPDAIRVDDKGNILGEFTNGKTFAVAKIAMASVANNSGLEEIGGNLFKVTANSGAIVVGEAGTGGRGEMKTSALEMSNVDLSRSLTELIIIQRGYQANSKTISTSDQMLQTLIQLKQ